MCVCVCVWVCVCVCVCVATRRIIEKTIGLMLTPRTAGSQSHPLPCTHESFGVAKFRGGHHGPAVAAFKDSHPEPAHPEPAHRGYDTSATSFFIWQATMGVVCSLKFPRVVTTSWLSLAFLAGSQNVYVCSAADSAFNDALGIDPRHDVVFTNGDWNVYTKTTSYTSGAYTINMSQPKFNFLFDDAQDTVLATSEAARVATSQSFSMSITLHVPPEGVFSASFKRRGDLHAPSAFNGPSNDCFKFLIGTSSRFRWVP